VVYVVFCTDLYVPKKRTATEFQGSSAVRREGRTDKEIRMQIPALAFARSIIDVIVLVPIAIDFLGI